MVDCPSEQSCRCVGQSLWDCLASLPWDRWQELFHRAMGGIALVGLVIIVPILLWKALNERTNPR